MKSIPMKSFAAIVASPLLCLGLLGGIALQQRTRLRADAPVVKAYHERALVEINAFNKFVTIDGVQWASQERKAETAAVRLLRPNTILSRHYVEGVLDRYPRTADLLIVQCRDSRDMTGHYPPICYKNIGYELTATDSTRSADVGGQTVPFTEYQFEKWSQGQPQRLSIYNFFVVPGRGVVRDIKGVHAAAEDYERRFFGAAQFQVLIPLNQVPLRDDRDRIFTGLIQARPGLIETLKTDGLSQ
jgi:hypothetical protein